MTDIKTQALAQNRATNALQTGEHAANGAPSAAADVVNLAVGQAALSATAIVAKAPAHQGLIYCMIRLAQLRREVVDGLAIRGAFDSVGTDWDDQFKVSLNEISAQFMWPKPQWLRQPDEGRLPLLVSQPSSHGLRYGVMTARNAQEQWVVSWWSGITNQFEEHHHAAFTQGELFARLQFKVPFAPSKSPTFKIVWGQIFSHKRLLVDVVAGTLAINFLALGASFYSMQVYDRVVPTQATSTLWVLTLGLAIAIVFELIGKWVRADQMHRLNDQVDQRLARVVYSRFLSIRLDQLPSNVGSTASRLKSYESVRSYLVLLTSQLLVDFPLALLALAVLFAIAGHLAWIPAVFLIVCVAIGLVSKKRTELLAKQANADLHFKTGLLVESVEGAEIIKSGQGGWRMLSRWLDVTDSSRNNEVKMREISERSQFLVASLQQLSYAAIVAFGALQVGQGSITMGALIACSILSGKVLNPAGVIPNLLVQWSQTQSSVQDLDKLWALQQDYPENTQALILDNLKGHYQLSEVKFSYAGNAAVSIERLAIQAGERVGIIGGIGSGKTTVLRLLSGMYKPQSGRVQLDSVDIDLISKSSLSSNIGYVPQDGRLFAGSLRDNLVLGLADPGDSVIMEAAKRTGLLDTVVAPHPKGLEREIYEGGVGLSGGQRQLVHVTRALLRQPNIWLLDEPTASMDQPLENKVLATLRDELSLRPESTLVLVTHKPQLLALVSRVIVFAGSTIVMDGPRDAVLQKLSGGGRPAAPASAPASSVASAASPPPSAPIVRVHPKSAPTVTHTISHETKGAT